MLRAFARTIPAEIRWLLWPRAMIRPKWELGGPASPCGAARRYITAQVSKPVRGEWQASRADMQRAAVSMLVMIAWFGVQFTSDYTHLIGQLKPTERRNPY